MKSLRKYLINFGIFAVITVLFVSFSFGTSLEKASIFTEEELTWIKAHPKITVAPDPAYAPIEFYENGQYKGFTIEYLKAAGELYGLQFEFIRYDTWKALLDASKRKEVQMLSAAVATEDRLGYLNFSTPYIFMPNQFFIRKGSPLVGGIDGLKDKKVGVIADYATKNYLRLLYPEISIVEVKDIEEGLNLLSVGELDTFVGDSGQVNYYAEYYKINNISMDGSVQFAYPLKLSMAVIKDETILLSIMNKVILNFPENKLNEIKSRWIKSQITDSAVEQRNRNVMMGSIFILSVIILTVGIWNRTLRKTVESQTERLRESLEKSQIYEKQLRALIDLIPYPVFTKDHSQHFVTVNEQYALFFGMSTKAIEGLQDTDVYMSNKNNPLNRFRILEDFVLSDGKSAHIKEYHLTDAQGNEHVYDIKKIPYPILNQSEMGLLGISVDITEAKRQENERIVALSRLVSNVAHQINTPLGNVISSASFLALKNEEIKQPFEAKTLKSKDLKQYFETVNEVNQVMKTGLDRLVNIVSAFKSLSISAEDLKHSSFSLKECIRAVVIEQSAFRTIDWEAHFDSDIRINTYQLVFEQILNQIINNSVAHGLNPKDKSNSKIEFFFWTEGDFATLKICDNGVGIPEMELPHVSDPLYSSAKYYGHLGLGLSISSIMAQQLLDGRLELENRPSGGLQVSLSFKNV